MTDRNAKILLSLVSRIKALEEKSIANVVEIGRLLRLSVDQLEHGEYGPWLADNFGWSIRTALRYRDVFEFSKSVNLAELDLSISAIYLLIGFLPVDDRYKAIITAAKTGRVSYARAQEIMAATTPPPIEPLPDDAPPPQSKPKPHLPKPDDDEDEDEDDDIKPMRIGDLSAGQLIERLGTRLRDPNTDMQLAIGQIGPAGVREIINLLKAALDTYNIKRATQAKADAAEAKSKHP